MIFSMITKHNLEKDIDNQRHVLDLVDKVQFKQIETLQFENYPDTNIENYINVNLHSSNYFFLNIDDVNPVNLVDGNIYLNFINYKDIQRFEILIKADTSQFTQFDIQLAFESSEYEVVFPWGNSYILNANFINTYFSIISFRAGFSKNNKKQFIGIYGGWIKI